MNRRTLRRVAIGLFLLLIAAAPLTGTEATKQLVPGVSLYQEIDASSETALIVNCVTVDLSHAGVSVKSALAGDTVLAAGPLTGRETVSSLTARSGALVGVNADFFPFTGDPLGICIIDGELVSEPARNRAAVGWSAGSAPIFDNPAFNAVMAFGSGLTRKIDGINRSRSANEVVVYTPRFGASTRTTSAGVDLIVTSPDLPVRVGRTITGTVSEIKTGSADTPIPSGSLVVSASGPAGWFLTENVRPGDSLSLRFDVVSRCGGDWSKVEQAVGGGPWLLKNGSVFIDAEAEGFDPSFSTTRHPRTALGTDGGGKLLLVTVDGRQFISRGIALANLAAVMSRLGAVNAINLDGGGSTTMSVRGIVVNSPSGGAERPVANAVLVFAEQRALDELPGLAFRSVPGETASGCGLPLSLTWGDGTQSLSHDQLADVVWGTTGGIGFVNQKGYFTPLSLRSGKVHALRGSQAVSAEVRVVAGQPAEVAVELVPNPQDPKRAGVKATVFDRNRNTLARRGIVLKVTGGTAQALQGMTDEHGEFATNITWDENSGVRSVEVTVDGVVGCATLGPG